MADSTRHRERRRRPRVSLNGEVHGKIHTVTAAPIIDLSEDGALIEVPCALRPGAIYVLRLPAERGELVIKSRVIRSYVHGFDLKSGGEAIVRYRTAVEFVDLGNIERLLLQKRLGRLDQYPSAPASDFETDFD